MSFGPLPTRRVRLPVMRQRWETLSFLHWDYPVETVQRLLPPLFQVEAWEGRAWVGVVAFHMRVRPPIGPALPGVTTFAETNVRTYVIGPGGHSGVWFFSLDAANAPAVVAGRLLYGLPYFLSTMRMKVDDEQIYYRSRRIGFRSPDIGHDFVVAPGANLRPEETGPLDHYLTARFLLWATHLGWAFSVPAEHPAWVLRRGRLVRADQNVLEAAGLPEPTGVPIVHYSDGVDVRLGRPERLTRRRSGRAHN